MKLTQVMQPNKRILVISIALSVVAFLFAGGLMFTSGYMISLAATIPLTVLAIHLPSIWVRIFGIGKPLIQYVERLASHDWVLRMTSSLRRYIYTMLERASIRKSTYGETLEIFAHDIEHIQDLYLRTIIPMVSLLVLYAIVVIAMGFFSPAMGIVLLILIGLICVLCPIISLSVNRSRIAAEHALDKRMFDVSTERTINVLDWRLSGRKSDYMCGVMETAEDRERVRMKISRSERWLGLAREVVCAVAICVVFFWAATVFGDASALGAALGAASGAASGVSADGSSAVASSISSAVASSISSVVASGAATADGFWKTGIASALGDVTMHDSIRYSANWICAFVLCAFPILEAFAQANEAVLGFERNKGVKASLSSLENMPRRVRSDVVSTVEDPDNAIEIRSLDFSYEGENSALYRALDLDVRCGERIAVIGRSGIGKTTLLDLIRGELSPLRGDVRVDGKIGYIDQAPYIFNMPLRENLIVANPDASDDEVIEVLRRVHLEGLFSRLEQGLDTMIAEDGIDISGGERHRIALARILLYDADVVLLDEPFQGLDGQTIDEISRDMFEVLVGRTVVIVTHDIDHLDGFDRIYRISDDGFEEISLAKARICV